MNTNDENDDNTPRMDKSPHNNFNVLEQIRAANEGYKSHEVDQNEMFN